MKSHALETRIVFIHFASMTVNSNKIKKQTRPQYAYRNVDYGGN